MLVERTPALSDVMPEEAASALLAELSAVPDSAGKAKTCPDRPLSQEAKQVLSHGAQDAVDLGHAHIGPEHLLLGLVREDMATSHMLKQHGLTRESIWSALARSNESPSNHR